MRNTFKKGLIDGLPVCLGYLSVAFAFGIFAVSRGLGVWQAVLISMTNVTSAGQLAGVPIIASGGLLSELAVSQFVINLRYALMSVSLSQKMDFSVRLRDKFIISFLNVSGHLPIILPISLYLFPKPPNPKSIIAVTLLSSFSSMLLEFKSP